jgi:hypothetical protein
MNDNIYTTPELPLASYLLSIGEELIGTEFGNSFRATFVFKSSPSLKQAVLDWANGTAKVNPRRYSENIKALKALAKSSFAEDQKKGNK